jgi:hypothetical protein
VNNRDGVATQSLFEGQQPTNLFRPSAKGRRKLDHAHRLAGTINGQIIEVNGGQLMP